MLRNKCFHISLTMIIVLAVAAIVGMGRSAHSAVPLSPAELERRAEARKKINEAVAKETEKIKQQQEDRKKAEKDQKTKANEEQRKQLEQQKQAAQPRVPPPPAGGAGPGAKPGGGMVAQGQPSAKTLRPQVVLALSPYDQMVEMGKAFATKVVVKAAKANEFSRLDIWITYSPLMVRPVRVFDYPIAKLIDTSKPMTSTIGNGVIHFEASLKEPLRVVGDKEVLAIAWEAIGEGEKAEIALRDPVAGKYSGVYSGKRNLLKSPMLDSPAALASLIHIIGPASQDRSKMGKWAMMADARKTLIEKPNPADSDPVTVQLVGPEKDPAVNEEFILDVVVSNTSSPLFDQLNLAISFDPTKAQVLDWDSKGWIRKGINVFDAQAHQDFPFDIHTRNLVDNASGRIDYQMGLSQPHHLKSGTVIRMKVRAIAPGAMESFTLCPAGQSDKWRSAVTAYGVNIWHCPPPSSKPARIAATR